MLAGVRFYTKISNVQEEIMRAVENIDFLCDCFWDVVNCSHYFLLGIGHFIMLNLVVYITGEECPLLLFVMLAYLFLRLEHFVDATSVATK
jgi:hypothetical protein